MPLVCDATVHSTGEQRDEPRRHCHLQTSGNVLIDATAPLSHLYRAGRRQLDRGVSDRLSRGEAHRAKSSIDLGCPATCQRRQLSSELYLRQDERKR